MDYLTKEMNDKCTFTLVDENFFEKNTDKIAFIFSGKYNYMDLYFFLDYYCISEKVNFYTLKKNFYTRVKDSFLYSFFNIVPNNKTFVLKSDLNIEYSNIERGKFIKGDDYDILYYVEHLVKPEYVFKIFDELKCFKENEILTINEEDFENLFNLLERDFYKKNIFSDMHSNYDGEEYSHHSCSNGISVEIIPCGFKKINDIISDINKTKSLKRKLTEDDITLINPKRSLEEIFLLAVKRYNKHFADFTLELKDLGSDTKESLKELCDTLVDKLGKFICAFEINKTFNDSSLYYYFTNFSTCVLKFENYALFIYYGNDE